jgi:MFS family permease
MPLNVPLESDFSAHKLRVAGACLVGTMFGTYLVVFGAMSFLMLPITQEFHWTRLQFSYAVSALMWTGALAMPLLGRIADRFGVRMVTLLVTIMFGVVTLSAARPGVHVWPFYICLALTGVFGQTSMIYNKVLGALFTRNRGKALGIFHVLATPIHALMPQITNALLTHYGWRGVFLTYGAVGLAIVPILFFWLEEPGSAASGGSFGRVGLGRLRFAALQNSPARLMGMTAGEARKDKIFWILVVMALFPNALQIGWVPHHVAFMVSRGFTQIQTANVISISFLFQPLALFVGGYVMDRIPTSKIAAPFALLGAIGMWVEWTAWSNFGGFPLLLLGVTLCAFALGSALTMQTYFFTRYFGMRAFAEIYGLCMAIYHLASGFGPPLVGRVFDQTGSYYAVILILAMAYMLSAVLALILGPYRYSLDVHEPAAPSDVTAATADLDAAVAMN